MSYSQHDLSEAQVSDDAYAHAVLATDAIDDLKQRIALAFTQWLYANQVTLKPEVEKPSWAHSFADTPEGLTEYRLAFFNDVVEDLQHAIEVG